MPTPSAQTWPGPRTRRSESRCGWAGMVAVAMAERPPCCASSSGLSSISPSREESSTSSLKSRLTRTASSSIQRKMRAEAAQAAYSSSVQIIAGLLSAAVAEPLGDDLAVLLVRVPEHEHEVADDDDGGARSARSGRPSSRTVSRSCRPPSRPCSRACPTAAASAWFWPSAAQVFSATLTVVVPPPPRPSTRGANRAAKTSTRRNAVSNSWPIRPCCGGS